MKAPTNDGVPREQGRPITKPAASCNHRSGDDMALTPRPSSAEAARVPRVMTCPANGARSRRVDLLTVKSLVRLIPLRMPKTQYYFCEAPGCDVVYFPLDKQAPLFRRGDLMVRVGSKETADPIPICYCFGFTRKDIQREIAQTGQSAITKRISKEVKAGNCACEVKNPSGKCCLGNVARAVEAAHEQTKSKGEVARSPAQSRTSRP